MTPHDDGVREAIDKTVESIKSADWFLRINEYDNDFTLSNDCLVELRKYLEEVADLAAEGKRLELEGEFIEWKDSYKGKLWSGAVEKCFKAPFPEVAVRHLLKRIDEKHQNDMLQKALALPSLSEGDESEEDDDQGNGRTPEEIDQDLKENWSGREDDEKKT